jgi:putative ubiquitin-RnfH superfamily antitoxin RatB of RatAB toxin-antitoxin module
MVMMLWPEDSPWMIVSAFGEAARLKFGRTLTVRLSVVVFVSVPEVPVIVTVPVPVAAVALAVKVSVLLPVAGLGLNAAVTPFGKPDAESVTLPLKPFDGVMAIALVPWLLCVTVSAFGEAARLKFGKALTVRLSVVVFVSMPDEPVIVTVTVPVAAVALAVKVSVLLLVAGLELNAAVTPFGKPDAESVTLPLKPFDGVMLIALVP